MNNRQNSNNNNNDPQQLQFPTHRQIQSGPLSSDQITKISLLLQDSIKKSAELSQNLPTTSQEQQRAAWLMQRAKLISEAGNKAREIARADRDLREANQSMSTTTTTTASLSPLTKQTQVAVQDNNKRQKIDSSSQRQIFTVNQNFNSRSATNIFTIQSNHRSRNLSIPVTGTTTTTTTTTTTATSIEESASLIATDLQETTSSNKTKTKRGSSFELCDENGNVFSETATLTYHIHDKGSYFTTENGRKIIYKLYFDEQYWITNNSANINLVKSVRNPRNNKWVHAFTEDLTTLSFTSVFEIKYKIKGNNKSLFFYFKNGEARQLLNQASRSLRQEQSTLLFKKNDEVEKVADNAKLNYRNGKLTTLDNLSVIKPETAKSQRLQKRKISEKQAQGLFSLGIDLNEPITVKSSAEADRLAEEPLSDPKESVQVQGLKDLGIDLNAPITEEMEIQESENTNHRSTENLSASIQLGATQTPANLFTREQSRDRMRQDQNFSTDQAHLMSGPTS